MRILIAAVGKAKAGPERALFDQYLRRLNWPVALQEVEERRALPAARRREREAELLLGALPRGGDRPVVVALDARGTTLTSEQFAGRLAEWQDRGVQVVAFLIGGADGLATAARDRADLLLSLGSMTWPHLLVRVLLAEQLYRAQSIIANHPYHRA
jgi:23S rRNA (pseudouridine1915-N3)-methyltransferase